MRQVSVLASMLAVGCTTGDGGPGDPSDGGVDAVVAPDSGPGPIDGGTAAFGEPCTTHLECGEGWCVDSGGSGGICSRSCDDGCPMDWICREVDVGSELASLCIPMIARQCELCTTDDDCPGGACLLLDRERRCSPSCAGDEDCATGYACAEDAAGERSGTFCQPVTGSCSCDSAMEGASRSCSVTNDVGTCWGTQTCVPESGWSACSADPAAAEVCDGVDDDCNFVIDDAVGGGEACEITVAGVGSCPGVRTCMGAEGFACHGQTPTAEACNYIDDDCDGSVDEDFPDIGATCTAGSGACARHGALRCTSSGSGTECSATAGAPMSEACNGADDDCDGSVDEAFPDLGGACTTGVGACARRGTSVCRSDGSATRCSGTPGAPGTETCNYQDDDCDGIADDPFRNAITGAYDRDTTCGSCEIDCTAIYGAAPNGYGRCTVSAGTPVCALGCDAGAYDLNDSTVDGCEFALDSDAIYVSASDAAAVDDAGCGLGPSGARAGDYPCRTIGHGLSRAAGLGRGRVLVADGAYAEAITLRNGIDLLGGYHADTWERHLATTGTLVQGVSSAGAHDRTVVATGITSATLFEGFVVRGSFNSKPGGNSYGIYVSGSSSNLILRSNAIHAGRGGSGASGAVGANGSAGTDGAGRLPLGADDPAYDSKVAEGTGTCNASNDRQYANGGIRSCAADVSGGDGGGNSCPPASDQTQGSAADGLPGAAGSAAGDGAAGAGGTGGVDGTLQGSLCTVDETRPMFGEDGSPGSPGANGAPGGAGCTASAGSVTAGHWTPGAASGGVRGRDGGGGGGGGAGGGGYCTSCSEGKHRLGGHGGGGGAGGCGGGGGSAGQGGGAAFGIFVVGGSGPTIVDNVILRGDGGRGASGGQGGAGGLGGEGGAGGAGRLFCTGKGGRGGDGGAGGHGSGGGGGCGGSSFGIYTSGVGTLDYCAAAANNDISGGAAGPGGDGGFSGGAPGGAGSSGLVAACSYN